MGKRQSSHVETVVLSDEIWRAINRPETRTLRIIDSKTPSKVKKAASDVLPPKKSD